MPKYNAGNNVSYLIFGLLTNSIFLFGFLLSAYSNLGKIEFAYLTGLFIFENILILFELSINNFIISKISSVQKKIEKNLIKYFIKKILYLSFLFFIFNLVILKKFFWDILVGSEDNLSLFLAIIVPILITIRIFINFFRAVLIGNFQQISIAKIQINSSSIKIILLILFSFFFNTIVEFLILYLLAFVTELLFYFIFCYKKFIYNFYFIKKYKIQKKYFFQLQEIFLLSLSIFIIYNIDRFFLSYKNTLNNLGEYNFLRTLLLGFFILGSSYYFVIVPNISKYRKKVKLLKQLIWNNFRSLNFLLIFIIFSLIFFFERFYYDFKLNLYFNIQNFFIFKILLLATYFNMMGQIFLAFQIGAHKIKIPTMINLIISILSLTFANILYDNYNIQGISFLYAGINILIFISNATYLHLLNKKIFSLKLFVNVFFNTLLFCCLAFFMLIFIDNFLYNQTKEIFYITLVLILLFVFYKSQKYLND
jgi:O-antigen/teichoic acid export membrane protein